MPAGRDSDGARWTVRRVWWPFSTWQLDLPDWGGLFVIGMVLTAPLVVLWPFWLLARFFGAPWTIVVRRRGEVMNREKVAGWSASRDRMAAILRHVCEQGDPELPDGVTLV